MYKPKYKYTYISYPTNLPLQIDGKSKKRTKPLKKQEFNENKGNMNEESKSLIMKKLSENVHDFQNMKSIIPMEA